MSSAKSTQYANAINIVSTTNTHSRPRIGGKRSGVQNDRAINFLHGPITEGRLTPWLSTDNTLGQGVPFAGSSGHVSI